MNNINVILLGIGNVGSALITQIREWNDRVAATEDFRINIPVVANSKYAFFNKNGLNNNWETDFKHLSIPYEIIDIINFLKHQELENLIVVDATANHDTVKSYKLLIENGCHIVAANKIANSLSFDFYLHLRKQLKKHRREFYYSTNVGAGLPVISTIKTLKASGDQIYKVRGVFSGSLSFIFNQWCEGDTKFSEIVQLARNLGYTEPDPRIDLSGKDVARKLLIIAREIGLELELKDIYVQSLVPPQLNGHTAIESFNNRICELDKAFQNLLPTKNINQIFRYVAELDVFSKKASVTLEMVEKHTNIGMLKGTNNIFEIYSRFYNKEPLTIIGSGAGKEVTANGILKDIIQIKDSIFCYA